MALFLRLTAFAVMVPLTVGMSLFALLFSLFLPLTTHAAASTPCLASACTSTNTPSSPRALNSKNLKVALNMSADTSPPNVSKTHPLHSNTVKMKTKKTRAVSKSRHTAKNHTVVNATRSSRARFNRTASHHGASNHTASKHAALNRSVLSRTASNRPVARVKNRHAAARHTLNRKIAGRPPSFREVALTKPLSTPATPLESKLYDSLPPSEEDHLSQERAPSAPLMTPPPEVLAALRSNVAYVQDLETSTVLFSKNEDAVRPIASISKLMTALVIIDANQPLDQMLQISDEDVDRRRYTSSRLAVGTRLRRDDMLHLALMSSENRAAHALGRYYPGGIPAFAQAMNEKARQLGMIDTHFVEPTGLSNENVSSPRDLVRLLRAAGQRPLIHRYTTDSAYRVKLGRGPKRLFRNTNALVNHAEWDIKVSKTGFIHEAGKCLVMLARLEGREIAIVLLDSHSKHSRIGDAERLRHLVQMRWFQKFVQLTKTPPHHA